MKKILIIIAVLIVLAGAFAVVVRHREKKATTPTPSTATSSSTYTPGTYNESMVTADGRTRTYLLHIPASYSSGKTYPLVLLFHGGMGTGQKILDQTNFATKADTEGFIVVAPQGVGNNWADGRGVTGAEKEGVDDVSFVRQLVANLESRLPVNPKSIYATGASNGGMMSERLGCDASDIFAAIGPDVGPMPTNIYAACKPSLIPVIGIQGGADPLVPINGGTVKSSAPLGAGGMVESAARTMQLWAGVDHCNATPAVTHIPPTVSDGTSVDKYTYSNCKADVVYYIVQGMGHGWPPNPPASVRISGKTSHNINATDVIWDFFKAHPKP